MFQREGSTFNDTKRIKFHSNRLFLTSQIFYKDHRVIPKESLANQLKLTMLITITSLQIKLDIAKIKAKTGVSDTKFKAYGNLYKQLDTKI